MIDVVTYLLIIYFAPSINRGKWGPLQVYTLFTIQRFCHFFSLSHFNDLSVGGSSLERPSVGLSLQVFAFPASIEDQLHRTLATPCSRLWLWLCAPSLMMTHHFLVFQLQCIRAQQLVRSRPATETEKTPQHCE